MSVYPKFVFLTDSQLNHSFPEPMISTLLKKLFRNYEKKNFNPKETSGQLVLEFVESINYVPWENSVFPVFLENHKQKEQLQKITNFVKQNSLFFRSKKLTLVVFDFLESHSFLGDVLDKFAVDLGHICQVTFVSANKKLLEEKRKFRFLYCNMWINHFFNYKYKPTFSLQEDHKLFLNLNRRGRSHRVKLLSEIIKNNLRNDGYITWADYEVETFDDFDYDLVKKTKFDTLDITDIENTNPTSEIPKKYIDKSFLWLNTETLYKNDCLFLSEKTYKPIISGMPFILFGNPNTLKNLKQDGFKTFERWIDESYDEDMHIHDRVLKIINELKKLKKMSAMERIQMRNEMKEVTIHNLNHYNELITTKNDLSDILIKLKNESQK